MARTKPKLDLYSYALQKMREDIRSVPAISDATGVPRETVRDLLNGRIKSPRLVTARKIMSYYAVML